MYNKQLPFQASILATAIALSACGGSSNGSSPAGLSGGEANAFTISAIGGNSASSEGGHGGTISISKYTSETPLLIERSGQADATFVEPQTTVQLGNVPATISSDTVVETITDVPAQATAGLLYLIPGNNRLYKYDGSDELATRAQEVTGLEIAAGAKLTLEANDGSSSVRLYFTNDINNHGSIETAVATTEADALGTRISVTLYPSAYHGTGSIITDGVHTGVDDELSDAQNAGQIRISAATIENSGNFSANGADFKDTDAGNSGYGGYISLKGSVFVSNSGDLSSSSGDTDNGRAGKSGNIEIGSPRIFNSGDLTADQGSGTSHSYNSQNTSVSLTAYSELINTGEISVDAGDISTPEGTGDSVKLGNVGGSIELALYGAGNEAGYGGSVELRKLINSGDLSANGGDTDGFDAKAGYGGYISLLSYEADEDDGTAYAPQAAVVISGNISANGGQSTAAFDAEENEDGGNGGYGGNISISHYATPAGNLPTRLAGYGTFDVDGGNGIAGGYGGKVSIVTYDGENEVPLPTAPITVNTDITANGGIGKATTAEHTNSKDQRSEGAYGGRLTIGILATRPYLQEGQLNIAFNGSFSANSSDSINAGFNSYYSNNSSFSVTAPDNITINGDISLNGGSDTEATDEDDSYNEGSDAGSILLTSLYGAINYNGTIDANGGFGTRQGGDGGFLNSTAKLANSIAGNISLNGGSAAVSEDDNDETFGGNGGHVKALSGNSTANASATISVNAGAGDEAGYEGGVFVNADCQQGICNNRGQDQGPR